MAAPDSGKRQWAKAPPAPGSLCGRQGGRAGARPGQDGQEVAVDRHVRRARLLQLMPHPGSVLSILVNWKIFFLHFKNIFNNW